MYTIKGTSLAHTFKNVCEAIVKHGEEVKILRDHAQDTGTVELLPAYVEVSSPAHSAIIMDVRASNPFAQIFETMWVYSGDDCVDTLKYFIPRAPDYADNGTHWRAGYGPRLRAARGYDNKDYSVGKYDQIKYIIDTLNQDPSSRRAIMTIWDPVKEYNAKDYAYELTKSDSKDYPCNIALQFIIRNGELNMIVKMRSNDALFGFSGINVFEWTWLQCMIAARLGVEVGSYYHEATSLHVYKNVWDKVVDCASANVVKCSYPSWFDLMARDSYWNSLDMENYADACSMVTYLIKERRRCVDFLNNWLDHEVCKTPIVDEPLVYIAMYALWKHDKKLFAELYVRVMDSLRYTDMKMAVAHFFNRNTKGVDSSVAWLTLKGANESAKIVARTILADE